VSRHNNREKVYQIEVVDYSRQSAACDTILVIAENNGHGLIKVKEDIMPPPPRRTLPKRFKSNKQAKKWGSRYGTVVGCHKVDTEYYLRNIEYLNLKQEPIVIEVETGEYVMGRDFEVARSEIGGREIIIEGSIDK
jgi:hypothetical protein